MKGKTCVVSGANAGIGYATALGLAERGAKVLMLCRNEEKGRIALEKIHKATGNTALELFQLDMGAQDQIRSVGTHLQKTYPVIDILVNNAGTWISQQTFTKEGVETVFAVNHLGYFQITHYLYPSLRAAKEARIINVASDNHYQAEMQFDDLNLSADYHGLRSYAQSKLGNVMFTMEFDRRKPDSHVTINAVQPGLVHTDIGLKDTTWLHGFAWKVRRTLWPSKTPAEGAATNLFLATSEKVNGISGKYWDNCAAKPPAKSALDPGQTSRLWGISQELCRIETYFQSV